MHQCFCYFVNEKQCTAQPFSLPIEMFYEVFRLSKVAYTTENKDGRGVLYQNAASRFEKKHETTLDAGVLPRRSQKNHCCGSGGGGGKGGREPSSLHSALSVPIPQPQPRLGTVLLQVGQLLGVDRPASLLPYKLHSIFICHA